MTTMRTPSSTARRLSGLAAGVFAAGLLLVVLDAQGRHPISGRVIAPVMGVGGAGWLERPERESEEAPSIAVRALELKKGQVVADIGAGSGYYTMRMAGAVGPSGSRSRDRHQTGMLDIVRRRVTAARLTNIETVLKRPRRSKLPADTLDLAMTWWTSTTSSRRRRVPPPAAAGAQTPGLVLLEFRKEDPRVPIRPEHKMSIAEVKAELEPEGFKLSTVLNDLPWQHILVLTRSDAP
jgi:hypothetical protein